MDHRQNSEAKPTAAGARGVRRPYSRPVLKEFGSVARLTQGTQSKNPPDSAGGGKAMP